MSSQKEWMNWSFYAIKHPDYQVFSSNQIRCFNPCLYEILILYCNTIVCDKKIRILKSNFSYFKKRTMYSNTNPEENSSVSIVKVLPAFLCFLFAVACLGLFKGASLGYAIPVFLLVTRFNMLLFKKK